MPGLVGIIELKPSRGRAEVEKEVEALAGLFSSAASTAIEKISFDNGAMASVRLKNSAGGGFIAESETEIVAFWGHLWDEEGLRRNSFGDSAPSGEAHVGRLLLDIYRREGIDGFFGLNGRFIIALWDKRGKRLDLLCDRYGFTKLYYRVDSDKILFASEYKAIIRDQGFSWKIDEQGVADFVTFGFPAEDRTFLSDIKLLPQASVITFEAGKEPRARRYWDYKFYSENEPLWDEKDYIDRLFVNIKSAVSRQISGAGRVAVPVSGGYDSRTLAAVIEKIGFKGAVETFSFGNKYSFDVVYGREISRKLGFSHTYIPVESTVLKDQAERFVWLLEGMVNCLNSHMLLTHQVISGKGLDSIVTGFFGDVTCGTDWLYTVGLNGCSNDDEILEKQYPVYADIMGEADLKNYLKDGLYRRVRGSAFELFRKRYHACPAESRYYKSRYFSLHERQRRYTSFNLFVFDLVGKVISPFLDNDLVEFCYRMPPHLAIHSNVYRKMIIKHLAKAAAARYNETRLPLNASWLREGLHWRWQKLVRNPLLRSTVGRKYTKMNDNYLNTAMAIRTGSKDFVVSYIKDNPFLSEFFNMDMVHKLLEDHMSGKLNAYGKITALLTLSIWHRLFVEGKGYGGQASI